MALESSFFKALIRQQGNDVLRFGRQVDFSLAVNDPPRHLQRLLVSNRDRSSASILRIM